MDRQTDLHRGVYARQTDGRMDGQTGKHVSLSVGINLSYQYQSSVSVQADGQTDGLMDGRMDRPTGRRAGGRAGGRTDRQTHRQTDTDIRTQATCHPHGRVFLMCYSQPYEGTFCAINFHTYEKYL